MSAEQYLKEMEKILRKIRRREVRKRAFNKYYKGNKKIDLIRSNCATYCDDDVVWSSAPPCELIFPPCPSVTIVEL